MEAKLVTTLVEPPSRGLRFLVEYVHRIVTSVGVRATFVGWRQARHHAGRAAVTGFVRVLRGKVGAFRSIRVRPIHEKAVPPVAISSVNRG